MPVFIKCILAFDCVLYVGRREDGEVDPAYAAVGCDVQQREAVD